MRAASKAERQDHHAWRASAIQVENAETVLSFSTATKVVDTSNITPQPSQEGDSGFQLPTIRGGFG
jgi:hypothetical protein